MFCSNQVIGILVPSSSEYFVFVKWKLCIKLAAHIYYQYTQVILQRSKLWLKMCIHTLDLYTESMNLEFGQVDKNKASKKETLSLHHHCIIEKTNQLQLQHQHQCRNHQAKPTSAMSHGTQSRSLTQTHWALSWVGKEETQKTLSKKVDAKGQKQHQQYRKAEFLVEFAENLNCHLFLLSLKNENLWASNCLICMAAGEARISVACLINLAASTSARVAMTFDSPSRFCWAADDKEAETSGLKMISLIRIPSMATPHLSATSPTISAISKAIASCSVTRLWTARALMMYWSVVWARLTRAWRRSVIPKAAQKGLQIWK